MTSSPRGASDGLAQCVFATPGPLRDRLVEAVLAGRKTATSSLLEEYGAEPLPAARQRLSVVDSAGDDVAVIEITQVDVVPMSEIDADFAQREGEGFDSAADWRRDHEAFWRDDPYVAELGIVIDDDTLIVAVQFCLVVADDLTGLER